MPYPSRSLGLQNFVAITQKLRNNYHLCTTHFILGDVEMEVWCPFLTTSLVIYPRKAHTPYPYQVACKNLVQLLKKKGTILNSHLCTTRFVLGDVERESIMSTLNYENFQTYTT